LGQVIGKCGALTPTPNVVEQNTTKRKPDWCFAETEPPEQGGEQLLFVKCR